MDDAHPAAGRDGPLAWEILDVGDDGLGRVVLIEDPLYSVLQRYVDGCASRPTSSPFTATMRIKGSCSRLEAIRRQGKRRPMVVLERNRRPLAGAAVDPLIGRLLWSGLQRCSAAAPSPTSRLVSVGRKVRRRMKPQWSGSRLLQDFSWSGVPGWALQRTLRLSIPAYNRAVRRAGANGVFPNA